MAKKSRPGKEKESPDATMALLAGEAFRGHSQAGATAFFVMTSWYQSALCLGMRSCVS